MKYRLWRVWLLVCCRLKGVNWRYFGGIGAGIMVRYLFGLCLKWQFPMTTINIVAGGLSGLFSGLVMYYLLSPLALAAGDYIKLAIEATLAFSPILAGLLAGLVIWPAILGVFITRLYCHWSYWKWKSPVSVSSVLSIWLGWLW